MPRYELVISNRFRRDLGRLDAQVHRRVLAALDALQSNPYQGQQLTEVPIGQWRIREATTASAMTSRETASSSTAFVTAEIFTAIEASGTVNRTFQYKTALSQEAFFGIVQ